MSNKSAKEARRSGTDRKSRGSISGVDPKAIAAQQAQGGLGLGAPQDSRDQRMVRMLALRRVARELERADKLYFLPVETNPLAVMGLLQAEHPEKGIDQKKGIPWSVLESLLPLPTIHVPGLKAMYYEVELVDKADDATTVQFTRRYILDEEALETAPTAAEEAPSATGQGDITEPGEEAPEAEDKTDG